MHSCARHVLGRVGYKSRIKSMVTLPKQKVKEVPLQCRFCTHHHFNTQNKGIAFTPRDNLSGQRSLNLLHMYCNIPHHERVQYGKNLPITVLTQMRCTAGRAAYEEGVLQLYHSFEYISSGSQSSTN